MMTINLNSLIGKYISCEYYSENLIIIKTEYEYSHKIWNYYIQTKSLSLCEDSESGDLNNGYKKNRDIYKNSGYIKGFYGHYCFFSKQVNNKKFAILQENKYLKPACKEKNKLVKADENFIYINMIEISSDYFLVNGVILQNSFFLIATVIYGKEKFNRIFHADIGIPVLPGSISGMTDLLRKSVLEIEYTGKDTVLSCFIIRDVICPAYYNKFFCFNNNGKMANFKIHISQQKESIEAGLFDGENLKLVVRNKEYNKLYLLEYTNIPIDDISSSFNMLIKDFFKEFRFL